MTKRGAVPDNGIAVERREAQGRGGWASQTRRMRLARLGAGFATLLRNPVRRPADRKAGLKGASPAPGRLPALHPLPFEGGGRKRDTGRPAARKKQREKRSVGFAGSLTIESERNQRRDDRRFRAAFFSTRRLSGVPDFFAGITATASISNKAPSRASLPIWIAVEAGGALVFT